MTIIHTIKNFLKDKRVVVRSEEVMIHAWKDEDKCYKKLIQFIDKNLRELVAIQERIGVSKAKAINDRTTQALEKIFIFLKGFYHEETSTAVTRGKIIQNIEAAWAIINNIAELLKEEPASYASIRESIGLLIIKLDKIKVILLSKKEALKEKWQQIDRAVSITSN